MKWADYANDGHQQLTANDPDSICQAIKSAKGYRDPYIGCRGTSAASCTCELHNSISLETYPIGYPFLGAHCPLGYIGKLGTYTHWREWWKGEFTRYFGPGTLQCFTPWSVKEVDRTHKPHPTCRASAGNPIDPLRGTKRQSISLDVGLLGRPLVLTYDSSDLVQAALPAPGDGYPVRHSNDFVRRTVMGTPGLPRGWFLSALKRMHMGEYRGGHFFATKAVRGNGDVVSFDRLNWYSTVKEPDVIDHAQWGPGLLYFDALAGSVESYLWGGNDIQSAVISSTRNRDGSRLEYSYSVNGTPLDIAPAPRYLIGMTDDLGRQLSFRYTLPPNAQSPSQDGRLTQISGADGAAIGFEYDAQGRLVTVRWADNTFRRFVYDDPRFPTALTGIVDERGVQIGNYRYDEGGRAVETVGAIGTGRHLVSHARAPAIVMREQFDNSTSELTRIFEWLDPGATTVVRPNGAQHTIQSALVNGAPMSVADNQPAGAGCNAATQARELDSNGLPLSVLDVSGYRSCMVNDPVRQLVTVQVDGLPGSSSCAAATQPGMPLPAGSRKATHEWHPKWRLKTRSYEPGRLTTYVYNGQPNPLNNGAIANCAPGLPRFPDDSVVPLLCAEIAAATLDLDGAAGAAAAPDQSSPARIRRYTYNANGRPATVVDERGGVTTYAYHPANTAHVRMGDLWQVINPLGHRISFERYDAAGRLLRRTDENSVATDLVYDLRGRLVASTTAGATTLLERDAAGEIVRVVQPDGTWLRMERDAAGRLVAVEDTSGNRLEYALDAQGHRISERSLDPSRQLRRLLERTFDALGRLELEVGAVQ